MYDGTFSGESDDALTRLRRALSDLGAHDAEQLLDAARAKAQDDVRDLLSRALHDSMLHVIEAELGDTDAAPGTFAVAAADALYVYGVIAGASPAGELPPGVDGGAAVRGVSESGLTALVSDVAAGDFEEERMVDLAWVQETAQRHELVIEAIGRRATVVPMRMATVYPGEDEIRALLAREVRPLRAALAHLQGKTEWGVKVYAGARRSDRSARRPAGDPARVPDDDRARRARERQARAWAAERAEDAAREIHDVLCTVSADSLIVSPALYESRDRPGDMLLNGVYLVRDAAREEFRSQTTVLAARFAEVGVELELTGPWPAYNFVPATVDAAW